MAKTPKLFTIERKGQKRWVVVRARLPSVSFDQFLSSSLLLLGLFGIGWALAPSFIPAPTQVVAQSVVAPSSVVNKPIGLSPSKPVHLDVPDIGLSTELIELGKNPDDTLETPTRYDIAGWYKYSPTPGEIGPSVIAGHVDNYLGPAVFFYLKDLKPGQLISVSREDGSTVKFQVEKVALFDQQNFPTKEVYGDIDYPGLRLITCGGNFNALTGHYSHNTVVYASLVDS